MKKAFYLMAMAGVFSISIANAQVIQVVEVAEVPVSKYSVQTNGFWDNWFVSLNAGLSTGSVMTRVLKRNGGNLEFNLSTSAGGAFRVEICDENGNTIPGYSFNDMKEFYGDSIAFVPQWKGKSFADLPAGKFRLRMKMRECDLFSISFK